MKRVSSQFPVTYLYAFTDEYVEDLAKKYLKIPTYTNNFVHVVSRKVAYKGFLKHSAQLNGGTLPYMTREVFENAWKELVGEKYKAWKTVHSETTKRLAFKHALSQVFLTLVSHSW